MRWAAAWLAASLLASPRALAADCDFSTLSATVEGITGGDYAPCVEAELKQEPFAAELLAIPTGGAVNEPVIHANLLRLAEALREDPALPEELRAQWADLINAMIPKRRSRVPLEAPSPRSFEQSANTEDSACGCAWVIGAKDVPGPFVCIASDAGAPGARPAAPAASASCPKPQQYTWRLTHGEALHAFSYAYLTDHGLTALGRGDRAAVGKRLHKARGKWDHLLVRGYTQFPWELPINSAIADRRQKRFCKGEPSKACEAAELDPYRLQLVFLHPSAGLGFTGFGVKHFDPDPKAVVVLNIEALGVLGYTKGFVHYFGASPSLSLADLDFGTPLIGFTLHLTRWIHLGYGASVVPGQGRSDANTLFVGADLFGVLSKWSGLD
jgi:hypothetical protein